MVEELRPSRSLEKNSIYGHVFQDANSYRQQIPDPAQWTLEGDAKLLDYMQAISKVRVYWKGKETNSYQGH